MKALAIAILLVGCASCTDDADADAAGFFLPTGAVADNTAAPTVRVDGSGATHAVYPAYAKGGAYYAYCPAGCATASATQVVKLDTPDGTTTNAMLALTSDGHPRVLLSAYQKAYFASCDADCGKRGSWTIGAIADKGVDQDITGDALALDPSGHPRFLMHTHVAYLGIGQKDPQTSWWSCDARCTDASGWTHAQLATEIWQGSTLRFDPNGVAKLTTVMGFADQILYAECPGGCDQSASWHGTTLGKAYESTTDIVSIHPRAAMALTAAGGPRIAVLVRGDDNLRALAYLACDRDCLGNSWTASVVSKTDKLGSGYAIALDGKGLAQIAYTLDYNIALASIDATGKLGMVMAAAATQLPADQIFLNYNCTVGGWLFSDPSVAMVNGKARIGFQARDISVAGATTDHTHGACVAGTDMTWSRLITK